MNLRSSQIGKKRFFKRRKFQFRLYTKWTWGSTGALLLSSALITLKQGLKFILQLKRMAAKRIKTQRFFWLKATALFPLTKKPQNSRMGKGKGKGKSWITRLKAGFLFIEIKGVRSGRFKFFIKQIQARFQGVLQSCYRLQSSPANRLSNY